MKKGILLAMLIGGAFFANAQTSPGAGTGSVTLNVNLHPIQHIEVNTLQSTVNLDYNSAEDYKSGVNVTQEDHLKIYSTGPFAVSVNSSTDKLTGASGNDQQIDAANIKILASAGKTKALANTQYAAAVSLSQTPTVLFSHDTSGGNMNTFNVNYKAAHAEDAYMNKYKKGQNPTTYTTQVTYSIAVK